MTESMEKTLFRPVSVGGMIKKILEINSDLDMQGILEIIQASSIPAAISGDYERFDEAKALQLAQSTL